MRWVAAALLLAAFSCGRCDGEKPAQGPTFRAGWLEGKPAATGGTPVPGGVLHVRAMSEPAGLNFLDDRSHDAWTSRITSNLIFESLLTIDPLDYELQPQLATAWTDSADHLKTTFTLRQGVKFQNGAMLTVEDVVATLDTVMNPKLPTGAIRGDFPSLASWKAIDASTVELSWAQASPFNLRAVAKLPIFSAAQLKGDWSALAEHPIGTGPFSLGEWKRGEKLTLKATGTWWGGPVFLEGIEFQFVKDHAAAAALFEKGSFELMTNVLPAHWREMEKPEPRFAGLRDTYDRIRSTDNSYSFIAWNERLPLFASAEVRRAIALMYPERVIASAVDLGLELPTTCPYFREGPSCDESLKRGEPNADQARALLKSAGWVDTDGDGLVDKNGEPARFALLMPAASTRLGKIGPLLQAQLKTIGIDMQLEKVDGATLSARLAARDFAAVSRAWTEFDREQELFSNFHSSQRESGTNFAGYASPEADTLLEQIRATWEPKERHLLEQKLHRKLNEDQPYLIMSARQSLDAAKRSVHGLVPSLLWYDLRKVWLDAPAK